ncbi:MAG: hypothetical protein KKD29_02025 [Candidatus Omnitrophica bacterium]|nr:hypothetical protein [Candidatus Omnitrophota bacterium]MBU4488964.1 hypothetical protein [Candidatus Omnitrophota bacterium]
MPKNLVYLCKDRLVSIDQLLPILMEIKALYPETNLLIVFSKDKQLKLIQTNYILWDCIQSMKARIYVMRAKNKLVTVIRLIKFISLLSFKDNIIMREKDTLPLHNIVMKILRKLSKIKEVKIYLGVQSATFFRNANTLAVISGERKGRSTKSHFFDGNYDYFLSSLSPKQLEDGLNVKAPRNKIITTGYTRKLPVWQNYMDEAIKRNKIINNDTYFLYILTNTYKRSATLEEPEMIELVEESLDSLKKYNSRIKTIFKPHAHTDMTKVKNLLDRINYSNYIIDYAHPFISSSKAKFVFGNVYSITMLDAYYQGRPIVEYCQYDPELFDRIGKQSYGGERYCDFFIYRDKKKLDEILGKLINNEIKVERDPKFMQDSFPETPPQFYEFLHKQFS